MKSPKGQGVKRISRADADTLMESIRRYRVLAGQLSNTCFNLGQRVEGGESTLKLVRDFDAAELSLCMTLKDLQLFKRLDETNASDSE